MAGIGWLVTRHREARACEVDLDTWRVLGLAALLTLAVVLTAVGMRWYFQPTAPPVVAFSIGPPATTTFATATAQVPSTQMAVSPDGRHVAFIASSPGAPAGLWVRALDQTAPRLLPGTNDASYPFWSPDSRSIGFFTQNSMKRVDIASGTPQTLCAVDPDARGGTWNADGVIVFARSIRSGLSRMPATGGTPTLLLDLREGEHSYRWPSFLPDGQHFLFHVRGSKGRGVHVGRLGTEDRTLILDDAPYSAIYSEPGYLLTVRDGTLLGYPFDTDGLRITGEPIRIADDVGGSTTLRASFSASPSGVLAYAGPLATRSRLQWVDRSGQSVGEPSEASDYVNLRIAPDGRRVAVTRVDATADTTDVWLWDVERNIQTRFTKDPGTDTSPVWSPDGADIMFRSDRAGGNFPFVRPAAADVLERQLLSVETMFLTDWTADRRLVFHGLSGPSYNVGLVPSSSAAKAEYVADSPATEIDGRVSPNGQWIAYSSDESDRMEVYLERLPQSGPIIVSTAGGSEPHWRRDGQELFYLAPDRQIMAVPIGVDGHPRVARPLFQTTALFPGSTYRMNYDVNADGTRFLLNVPVEGAGRSPITVVVNWAAGLGR